MTIHNIEIAAKFNQIADLLEIQGENPFRIRAYRNAARELESLPQEITDMIQQGVDLTTLPTIGDDLAKKIEVMVKTGEIPYLKKLETQVPLVLSELLKVEGLGPKRVKTLFQKLNVQNADDLRKVIESGKLRTIKGFGEKLEQKISAGMLHVQEYSKRTRLSDAFPIVESFIKYFKKLKEVKQVECAGSFRRRRETVGDLDILISSNQAEKIITHFVNYEEVDEILSQGDTRSSVRLHSGIQVDLRVVDEASYGAALLYFTGSKAHNIAIRKMAVKMRLKINEYGIYRGEEQLAGKTEKDVYKQIGLAYIEPEMREDRGEIVLAQKNELPKLITLNDIKGDLHCHTTASDGDASIEQMVEKAQALNYEYIALTEHSKSLTIAHGLDEKRLLQQLELIDKLNAKLKKFVILKSMEVDILEDGTLDLSEDVLKQLDLTVCAVHSKFNLSERKQTERILRAMDNPYFNIFAHPTGRLINKRQPYAIDLDKIMQAAKERGCVLELNAQPERMELDDVHCLQAKNRGVKIVISTDSHSTSQLDNMKFGVFQARRGWLEAKDVINTHSLKELQRLLKRD
jgi:DNA polymerase (family 10)